MQCGKLTESIYNRSVIKVIQKNSEKDKGYHHGAGLRADCAILAENTTSEKQFTGMVLGQATATGTDMQVAARAYIAAVNQMTVCAVSKAHEMTFCPYATITLLVPEKLREIKIRNIVETAAVKAAEMKVPIVACDVQVLPSITESVAVCVVNSGIESSVDTTGSCLKGQGKVVPGEEIVMTKWAAIEGTALVGEESFAVLCGRYPEDIVKTAVNFYQQLSIVAEAACAVESGASAMQVLREGGVFGGLWQLAQDNGVGLVVDLKNIPIRQETIELCEFFDLNPYVLLSGGSLLITTSESGKLLHTLQERGIYAAVIGHTTAGNDRVILRDEETRYLEPARGDEIFQYKKNKHNI